MPALDLMIVGVTGNTHIATSLERAAAALGKRHRVFDTAPAYEGPALRRRLVWRLGGRRPYDLDGFSQAIARAVEDEPPRVLLTLGHAPVTERALERARARGAFCINWSTDDPWNPVHRAAWHLRSLRGYDRVFTPRSSNIDDFRRLGCADVAYLPFGYDPALFSAPDEAELAGAERHAALFVGGGDRDRRRFFRGYRRHGPMPALVGGYWSRSPATRAFALGHKSARELRLLTAAAAANLCLVRRANRDGHVMRTFEIPAVGGFMIAEDTHEHRAIFGEEGARVCYFGTPEEAARKARWAAAHRAERSRMAAAAHALVTTGGHSYRDRLKAMLMAANDRNAREL